MEKITQENIESEYKEAIRKKYRSEKVDGKYSHYLANPSQAALRDLCWEVFNSNPKEYDLVVYRNFFRSEFNSKEEDTSTPYTDKFKKVGAFLRGGIQPAKITTVELAAILVDFEPRPFKRFRERGIILVEEPIGSPKTPFAFNINNDTQEENYYKEDENEEDENEEDENDGSEIEGKNNKIENDYLSQNFANNPNDLDLIIIHDEKSPENQESLENEVNRFDETINPNPFIKEEKTEVNVEELEKQSINTFVDVKSEILPKKTSIKRKDAIMFASIFLFVGLV
ncbi:MAG: hypothetical protein WAM46_20900, partial [Flavobacterium sp.]